MSDVKRLACIRRQWSKIADKQLVQAIELLSTGFHKYGDVFYFTWFVTLCCPFRARFPLAPIPRAGALGFAAPPLRGSGSQAPQGRDRPAQGASPGIWQG
jgi:hypothetical protein